MLKNIMSQKDVSNKIPIYKLKTTKEIMEGEDFVKSNSGPRYSFGFSLVEFILIYFSLC